MIELPQNLDAMTSEELRGFSVALSKAEHQVPGRQRLISYAVSKAKAFDKRLAGDIPEALRLERHCDRMYRLLPDSVKW